MRKAFSVLLNILSFGVPLLIRALLNVHKFRKLVNKQVYVDVVIGKDTNEGNVFLTFGKSYVIPLEIDRLAKVSLEEQSSTEEE